MRASQLRLKNFRNYQDYSFDLSEGLTILVGPNAVGKTNCIEALQLLSAGYSFKHPLLSELILDGQERAHISYNLEGEGRKHKLALEISLKKKSYLLNSKTCSFSQVRGLLPSVLFNPDDLRLVKDAPQYRRDALDQLGIQLNEKYGDIKLNYEKSLQQRNKLLREERVDENMLAAWTESLCSYGLLYYRYRRSLFERLKPWFIRHYSKIAPHENIDIHYIPSFTSSSTMDSNVLRETLLQKMKELELEERIRKRSLVGPHRDDFTVEINGRSARSYASQGQQRSIVLALKQAELSLIYELIGYYPLLLLDDVMSELDEQRRSSLLSLLNLGIQTVVSTTHLSYFSQDVISSANLVELNYA